MEVIGLVKEVGFYEVVIILALILLNTFVTQIFSYFQEKGFKTSIRKVANGMDTMKGQVDDIHRRYTNRLSLGVAKEVIEAQYGRSRDDVIGEVVRIYTDNDISNPKREKVIRETFPQFVNRVFLWDQHFLSNLMYGEINLATTGIGEVINPDSFAQSILKRMFEYKETKADIVSFIRETFSSNLAETKKKLNEELVTE